jgi:hypothetical protein
MHPIYIVNLLMIAINSFMMGMLWDNDDHHPYLFLLNLVAVALNIATVSKVILNV